MNRSPACCAFCCIAPDAKDVQLLFSATQSTGEMKRKGHGSKHSVSGKLDGGSPWFYPDDPIEGAVSDRDTHQIRPVFLCVWEFLDKDIRAPSCPRCRSSDNVVSCTCHDILYWCVSFLKLFLGYNCVTSRVDKLFAPYL